MAEKSWGFSTTTDFGEDEWRRWARVFTPDGVHGSYGSTTLQVTASGDGLSINIAVGFASIQSGLYSNDATLNKTNTANGGGSARPDRVVLRYDQTTNNILATVREGTVGGAAPPVLTQAVTGQWDIPLARWSRAAGGGIGSLVDERQFLDRSGGLVMADAAVTAAVPLTALVPSPWVGQRVTLLGTGISKEFRWTGTFWERTDSSVELYSGVDGTQIAPTNLTFATAAGTAPSGTFVAPSSGRVKVTVSSYINAPAGFAGNFSARITGPAGFDNLPSESGSSVARVFGNDGFTAATATAVYYVSGMTAGSTYTATGVHAVTGTSGHQRFDNRRVIIERA